MTTNDVKLTILNGFTLAISFSNMENFLKIFLLLISIIYTCMKTYEFYTTKIKKQDGSDKHKQDTDTTSED